MANEMTNRTDRRGPGRLVGSGLVWPLPQRPGSSWDSQISSLPGRLVCIESSLAAPVAIRKSCLLTVVITFVLFAIILASGTVSYRNWRRLSADANLESAEGRGREEFMALLGVFVSLTLGFSVIWLALPLFILDLCVRTR